MDILRIVLVVLFASVLLFPRVLVSDEYREKKTEAEIEQWVRKSRLLSIPIWLFAIILIISELL
jgi:uncharacterized membrane protein